MKLDTGYLIDPARNLAFMALALTVAIFVFAYSTRFGQVSILAFYACWLPLLALRPGLFLPGLGRVAVLGLLPALALLSVIWSDLPAVSLRAAIQYATTVLAALIAARLATPRSFAIGGMAGVIAVLAYSFLDGTYAYDVIDGSYAFQGAFSSKNQLGLFASLGVVFAAAILLLFPAGPLLSLAALGAVGMGIAALMLSRSTTSIITLIGTLGLITAARIIVRLAAGHRRAAIALGLVMALAMVPAIFLTGVFDGILAVFGKDTTLTGRTFLWREGILFGHEHPVRGLGYYAFWTHGRPLAEALWEVFYITARTGFHFHNTYIEVYVALGLVGLAAMLGFVAALLLLALRVLMNRHLTGEGIFCAGLAVMFTVRSLVEIDFFTPYTVGAFVVFYCALQMADQRALEGELVQRRAARARRAAQRLRAATV
ncbi:MAG: O-antigen ligase [Pseudomonadota bacterium]